MNLYLFRKIFVLIAPFLIFGCSTIKHSYDGPKKNFDEIALVEGFHDSQFGRAEGLYVVGVDGTQFPHFNEYPYGVYLLPGKHELTIQYWLGEGKKGLSRHVGYILNVEAGKKYHIKFKNDANRIHIWIENELGKLVGFETEPKMNPEIYGWIPTRN